MSWTLDDKEYEASFAMSPDERYVYFVTRVVENEEAWGLWSKGGWRMIQDGEGGYAFPVWPHSKYAEDYARDVAKESTPKLIPIATLLDNFVRKVEGEHAAFAVFPTADGPGLVVPAEDLRGSLREQMVDDDDEFYDEFE